MRSLWNLHDLVRAAQNVVDKPDDVLANGGAAYYAQRDATAAQCRDASTMHFTSPKARTVLLGWAEKRS